jgi:hypothetical protein
MKTISRIVMLLLCILMMNCASNVRTKKINNQNPFDYKTYAYLPDTGMDASTFNRDLGPSMDAPAIEKLNDEMSALGFSKDLNNPDMVVLISDSNTIKSNQKKDGRNSAASQSTSGTNSPYSGGASGSSTKRYTSPNETPSTRPYQNGNMVIEFFNSKTKELIWVGSAKNFKSDIAGQNLSGLMVTAIFDKFPKNSN